MRNAECEKMDVLLSISISSIKTARDKQKKMRYSAFRIRERGFLWKRESVGQYSK